jgi:hypothetical protein
MSKVDSLSIDGARKDKIKGRIQKALKRLPPTEAANAPSQPPTAKGKDFGSGILVFKSGGATPNYRWVSYSTNAFKDREREILSTDALYKSVDRMDARQSYGPLRFWHVGDVYLPPPDQWDTAYALKGVDLGQCDYCAVHDRVLIESGTFKSAVIAEHVMKSANDLAISAGFTHPPGQPEISGGVYTDVNIFERSLLPRGKAANELTGVLVTKELNMNIKAEKLAALKALLGNDHDAVVKVLGGAEAIMKEAAGQNLSFKELGAKLGDKDAPVPDALINALKEIGIIEDKAAPAPATDGDPEDVTEPLETPGEPPDPEDDTEDPEGAMIMGDMTPKEFKSLFTDPVIKAVGDLAAAIAGTMKAAPQTVAGDAVVKALKALDESRADLDKRIKSLEGSAPTLAASDSPTTLLQSGVKRKSYTENSNGEVLTDDDRLAKLWVGGQ